MSYLISISIRLLTKYSLRNLFFPQFLCVLLILFSASKRAAKHKTENIFSYFFYKRSLLKMLSSVNKIIFSTQYYSITLQIDNFVLYGSNAKPLLC